MDLFFSDPFLMNLEEHGPSNIISNIQFASSRKLTAFPPDVSKTFSLFSDSFPFWRQELPGNLNLVIKAFPKLESAFSHNWVKDQDFLRARPYLRKRIHGSMDTSLISTPSPFSTSEAALLREIKGN